MTIVYVIIGAVVVVGFAIWLAVRTARERGKAEGEAATNKRMADLAEAQGSIIAEHRDPSDASARLRRGDF